MNITQSMPGDWQDISEFRLPVQPENAAAIRALSNEIARRLNALDGNWNFDFQFGEEGQLQTRERDTREHATRISLDVSRIHDVIRQVLKEADPRLPPPRNYDRQPCSSGATTSPPETDGPAVSPSVTSRFSAVFRRWFPYREFQPAVSEPENIRRKLRERCFRFFDGHDKFSQFTDLTRWLEQLQNDGQLSTLLESATKLWDHRQDRKAEKRQ